MDLPPHRQLRAWRPTHVWDRTNQWVNEKHNQSYSTTMETCRESNNNGMIEHMEMTGCSHWYKINQNTGSIVINGGTRSLGSRVNLGTQVTQQKVQGIRTHWENLSTALQLPLRSSFSTTTAVWDRPKRWLINLIWGSKFVSEAVWTGQT